MSAPPSASAEGLARRVTPSAAILALAALACGLLVGALAAWRADLLAIPARWSAEMGLGALLTFAFLVAVARKPELGLTTLLVVVYANVSEILVRSHGLPSLLQLFVPLLLLLVALERLTRAGDPALAPLVVPHGALFAMAGVAAWGVSLASTCWALDTDVADAATLELAKAVALGIVVAHVPDGVLSWRRATATIVVVGAVLAAMSSYQVLGSDWSQTFGGLARVKRAHISGTIFRPRATGPLADPNFYAQALLVLVPIAVCHALTARRRALRAAAWCAAGVLCLGVVTTYSRGGAIALGVTLALMAFVERRRIRAWHVAAAAGVVVAALALVPATFFSRLGTLSVLVPGQREGLQAQDSSVNKRRVLMGAAAAMALENPVLGVGAGNFSTHFEEYSDRIGAEARIYQDPGDRAFPHSLPLEIAAETGLLGLLAFGASVACALSAALAAGRRFALEGDDAAALLARSLAVGVVGYLASSLILHGDYVRYLWLLLGLCVAAVRVAPPAAARRRPPAGAAP